MRIDLKLSQLRETIDVHQAQGPEAAVALVLTGRSKATMDAIRLQVRGMQAREQQALGDARGRGREHLSAGDGDRRGPRACWAC